MSTHIKKGQRFNHAVVSVMLLGVAGGVLFDNFWEKRKQS